MSVINISRQSKKPNIYYGLSTDIKPTPSYPPGAGNRVGSLFFETDTLDIYTYNGSAWILYKTNGRDLVSDPFVDIKRGLIPSAFLVNKYGAISSTGTHTDWKPITSSETYFTPTAAVALEAVSDDNTNDTAGGAGALKVRVFGLKLPTSTMEETEDISLNGTTAVPLANNWWRVYRVKVLESGTYAAIGAPSHNSVIDIREVATPANVWAQIISDGGLGFSQSLITAFTIPVGMVGHLITYHAHVSDTNGNVGIALFSRENADDVTTPFTGVMQVKDLHTNIAAGGEVTIEPEAPILSLDGPADVGILSRNSVNQSYDVSSTFQLLVVDA